jgi:hypothetical protein
MLIVALALAAPAPAQVDSGVIADPISRRDLDRYAATLALSEQQRRELDRMHDTYVAAHKELRDGPLAQFNREFEHFSGSSSEVSDDVDAEQKAERALRRMHGSLRAIDARFFDELATVLSEEQLARLPHVRAARDRDRFLKGPAQTSYHPALDTDMSLLYADFADEIAPEAREATDAQVDIYQRALARAARNMHEHALTYRVKMAAQLKTQRAENEATEAAGEEIPVLRGDFALRAMLVRDAQTALAAKAADVGDLHRQLYTSLLPLLDEARQDALRKRFFRAVYRRISAERGPATREFERVLGRDDLPPRLAKDVREERAAFIEASDRILNKMLDNADAQRRSNASHSLKMMLGDEDPYVYDDPADFDRTQKRLESRLARLNRDTVDRVQALLDEQVPGLMVLKRPEVPGAIDLREDRGLHSSISMSGGQATYGYKFIPLERLIEQFGAGKRAIGPIAKRRLMQWVRQIGVPSEHEIVIDVLHDDYRDRYDDLDDTGALAALRVARESLFAFDEDGRPSVPDEEIIRALFRLERSAVTSVRTIDTWFFQQISIALGKDFAPTDQQRLERARSREMFLSLDPPEPPVLFRFGDHRLRSVDNGERPGLDLTQLVGDLELPDDVAGDLAPLLLEYETAATQRFQDAFDTVRRFDEHRALLMARHLRFDDENGLVAEGMHVDDEMNEASTRLVVVIEDVIALNRDTYATLSEALSSPYREQLGASYKRAAWPRVFADERALHGALETALAMEDLTGDQRDAIAEMSLGYRRDYDALSDRIIESRDEWQEARRHHQERRDLSDRARRRLRELLTPEQVTRVAGLAEAPEGS